MELLERTPEGVLARMEDIVQKDHDLLMRLEVKVDEILLRRSLQEGRMDDHEKRLRELESTRWRIAGIATVLSVLIPVAVSLVSRFLAVMQ